MCGIAGYNVSKRIFDKYLKDDPEKQKDILRQAWLHNLHRGIDACGYMGQTEDHHTDWYKSVGSASHALTEDVDRNEHTLAPFKVFGAHTRAGTQGKPDNLDNNHPVMYGKWLVTHNGHISNAIVVRNRNTSEAEREGFPDVDSAVIPLALDVHMDNAYDVQGLYDACRELTGAFSFHAVNVDNPGVSIFVRSTGRPFTVANLAGSAFVYGSEPESVWAIINRMGINPNKGFDWWSLDTDHFVIVEEGEIIKWGSFRSNNQSGPKTTVKRWLPREGDRKRELVYQDDSDFMFANKTELRSVLGSEGNAQLVYTRDDGFLKGYKDFPFDNEHCDGAVISEADVAYEYKGFLHAFYGNVEVVFGNNRTIKDVFNHDLPFTMGQRFEEIKPKRELFKGGIPSAGLDLKDFIRLHTTDLREKEIPEQDSEYEYVTRMRKEAERKKREKNNEVVKGKALSLPRRSSDSTDSTSEGEGEEDDETSTPQIISPDVSLTWSNFHADTVPHENEPLFFLDDRICPNHELLFSKHPDPSECLVVLYAAAYAMAACESLDLFNGYEQAYYIDSLVDEHYCLEQKDNSVCQWIPADIVKITNTHTSWYVRVSEYCRKCGAMRELREDPVWFEMIRASDRLNIEPKVEMVNAN